MKTIKLEIPQGFTFDSFDETTGEIKLKPMQKPVTDRIKTIDDVLAYHGLIKAGFDRDCQYLSDDEKAYRLLKLMCQALNEGWEPDWNINENINQIKYYPWFEIEGYTIQWEGCGRMISGSSVSTRLCFKSSELAKYAGKQFAEVYKQFMLIP